jgi:hypothetical protein
MSKIELKAGQVWDSKDGKRRNIWRLTADADGLNSLESAPLGKGAYVWYTTAEGGKLRKCYMGTWQDWADGATLVGGAA